MRQLSLNDRQTIQIILWIAFFEIFILLFYTYNYFPKLIFLPIINLIALSVILYLNGKEGLKEQRKQKQSGEQNET